MRRLDKRPCPTVLAEHGAEWLAEYLVDRTNRTRKYRYRDPAIKAALLEETGWKCVYCESMIGHNTAGDIEHKVPSSKDPSRHFDWTNLTTACSECNRRKNDYYEYGLEFLDPYLDDVEELLEHHGPFVSWKTGEVRAEITIRILELGEPSRIQLVLRKIEKIKEFCESIERYTTESSPVLKALLLKRLQDLRAIDAEYSAMLTSVGRQKGIP